MLLGCLTVAGPLLARLLLLVGFAATKTQSFDCVFIENMHFTSSKQYPNSPAKSKEECCDLCHESETCAAGIFSEAKGKDPTLCWFKPAAIVKPENEQKLLGNTACVRPEYATPAERAQGKEADDGVDTRGTAVVIVLLGAMAAYAGGGLAIGHWQGRGSSSGGLTAHPHYRQWKEVQGLVQDGLSWTVSGGKSQQRRAGGHGYRDVDSLAGAGGGENRDKHERRGSEASRKSSKSAKSSRSKGKKEKKSSSGDGGSSSGGGGAVAAVPAPAVAAVPAPAPAKAAGTASGGGGRWVHVSE